MSDDALIEESIFFTFHIKDNAFAVPLCSVESLVELPETNQGESSEAVLVMNFPYQNNLVKVFDFMFLQRNEFTELGIKSCILILKKVVDGEKRMLGIVIESIKGIVETKKNYTLRNKTPSTDKYILDKTLLNGIYHQCIDIEGLIFDFQ